MRRHGAIIAIMGCLLPMAVTYADKPIIVEDDKVTIDAADLRALAELQVPEERAAFFWGSEDAIRDAVANLYLVRRVAAEAREAGLDEEKRWEVDYFTDRALMNLQLRDVMRKRVSEVDLEALAKERYLANGEDFVRPEAVRVSHILVDTKDREKDEARSIAERLAAKVRENPDQFAELAKEHSDDEGSAKKGGDLGFFSRGRMVKPFEDAAFALEKPGQIAGPIETQYGFHILRLEERRAESKQPFEQVKSQLLKEARNRVENRAREEYLAEIRSAGNIESDQEAIKALVRPLPDPERLLDEQRNGSGN